MKFISKLLLLSLLSFSFFISFTLSAKEEDLVKNLFNDMYKGNIYSGYLSTEDPNRKLHYLFLNSQSNTKEDPLVLWLNGGPGCSSLLGFIQENGPVVIPDYTTELQLNNFSWNKNANILYLESPAGVGFSYTDNGEADLKYDDEKTANDNLMALLDFFKNFPEFKANDFYISGESYAGVYVPKLAENILKKSKGEINLQGILVGNGLTDLEVDIEGALIDFAYGHGLYSIETRNLYQANCNSTVFSEECISARKEIKDSLQGLNIYDVYRNCPKSQKFEERKFKGKTEKSLFLNTLKRINHRQKENKLLKELEKNLPNDSNSLDLFFEISKGLTAEDEGIWPDACLDDPFPTDFFNKIEIKEKLHIRTNITYVQCNDFIEQNYKISDSLQIYKDTLLKSGIRIWFYSGDTDGAVPFTGTIKWLKKLNMDITEPYRRWVVNGQTSGYVQAYDSMVYLTVLGTGHMAPQWKREQVFVMFNAFLKGERLPQ